nr:plasmid pRiA4b ORF-3 family protein [uncultured Caulobacter sp.]
MRIDLLDTEPAIWRQVEVPTSMTLTVLHDVVQAAMGWCDQHLWELRQGKQRYGQPISGDDWGGSPTLKADKVRLREILKPRKTALDYTYDFGDSWEHWLTLTDVRPGDPDGEYPRYIAGERAAPPEDCGGIPGFYGALEVLDDPKHPDHADINDWFDGFDPDAIDEQVLKIALSRIARRRNSAKAIFARKARS